MAAQKNRTQRQSSPDYGSDIFEMLIKVSRNGVPILVSGHSSTKNALALSETAGITLVCHASAYRYSVFTFPERVGYRIQE